MSKKSRNKMSEYEQLEARLLYRAGHTQSQIADLLGYSSRTISRLKQANGKEWDKERLPQNLSLPRLIRLVQEWIYLIAAENVQDRNIDSFRGVLNLSRLIGSLRSLEEISESVSLRDKVQVSEDIMSWCVEKKYTGTLEQLQEYHDTHLAYM